MKKTKAKWIGIIVVGIVAFIHVYSFILIYTFQVDPYYVSRTERLDIAIPFIILFSIAFGDKVGSEVLINRVVDSSLSVVIKVLVKIVLSTIIIFIFVTKGFVLDEIMNIHFIVAIPLNGILSCFSGFAASIILILIK